MNTEVNLFETYSKFFPFKFNKVCFIQVYIEMSYVISGSHNKLIFANANSTEFGWQPNGVRSYLLYCGRNFYAVYFIFQLIITSGRDALSVRWLGNRS